MKRRFACALVLSLGTGLGSCSSLLDLFGKEEDDNTLLLLLGVAYFANPCNFAGTPTIAGGSMVATMAGHGSVKGKFLQKSGIPVVNALVIMDDVAVAGGANFWSTHASVNRDGTFLITGVPTATNSVISIEPIYSDYYGRIDTHIDCFLTPPAFTAGYFRTSNPITTTRGLGTQFTVSSGTITDLGTSTLLE